MELAWTPFAKIHKNFIRICFMFIMGFAFQANACYEMECPLSLIKPIPRYNITASQTHKFVWFRVAKVGTRTILSILQKNVPLTINDYSVPYNSKDYEDFFKFAFVRNPWSRVVSCYCNKVLTKCHPAFEECYDKDFAYFVDFINRIDVANCDPHIKLQTRLFPINELDFIGRLETFSEDLQHVLSMLNINDIPMEHKNSSKHEHYSHYYTERTKKIIAKKYKADIKAFNYQFEYEFSNSEKSMMRAK